jgi:hypothetical protein
MNDPIEKMFFVTLVPEVCVSVRHDWTPGVERGRNNWEDTT